MKSWVDVSGETPFAFSFYNCDDQYSGVQIEGRRNSSMKKVLHIFSIALQILVILLAGLLLSFRLLGWEQYTVLTGSMEPGLPVGSLLVVRPVEKEDISVGDVITFYSSGGQDVVTHRVLDVTEDHIITKGDANNVRDPSPVPFNRVKGKLVFSIPLLGFISLLLEKVGVLPVLLIIFGLILLAYILPRFWKKEHTLPE